MKAITAVDLYPIRLGDEKAITKYFVDYFDGLTEDKCHALLRKLGMDDASDSKSLLPPCAALLTIE